jgi:hypothetical protein
MQNFSINAVVPLGKQTTIQNLSDHEIGVIKGEVGILCPYQSC